MHVTPSPYLPHTTESSQNTRSLSLAIKAKHPLTGGCISGSSARTRHTCRRTYNPSVIENVMHSSTHITDKAYLNLRDTELISLIVTLEEEPDKFDGIKEEDVEK